METINTIIVSIVSTVKWYFCVEGKRAVVRGARVEENPPWLLTSFPAYIILSPFHPSRGAVMRRRGSGVECGARGLEETHLQRSGGAGVPPGGTRTPREELADGACYLPKGRSAAESAARSPARHRHGAPRGAGFSDRKEKPRTHKVRSSMGASRRSIPSSGDEGKRQGKSGAPGAGQTIRALTRARLTCFAKFRSERAARNLRPE